MKRKEKTLFAKAFKRRQINNTIFCNSHCWNKIKRSLETTTHMKNKKIIHRYGATYFQWFHFGLFILVSDKRFEFIGLFKINGKITFTCCMKFAQCKWYKRGEEKNWGKTGHEASGMWDFIGFFYIYIFFLLFYVNLFWMVDSYFILDWRFRSDEKNK